MKKEQRCNYRVEVYPKTTVYGIKVAEEKTVCESMIAEIKRHVNDVSSACLVSDDVSVCAFCGRAWTESGNLYNDGCCAADIDAQEARKQKGA